MRPLPTWSKQLMMHMLKNLETNIRDTCNVCVDVQDCHMLAIHSATPSNTTMLTISQNLHANKTLFCNTWLSPSPFVIL